MDSEGGLCSWSGIVVFWDVCDSTSAVNVGALHDDAVLCLIVLYDVVVSADEVGDGCPGYAGFVHAGS